MSKNKNNITGDKIISKKNSTDYTDNFDAIFRKRKAEIDEQLAEAEVEDYKENKDGLERP
jgi:hypothetical protein